MKVHYPKLYNMAHLHALNILLLPKDLTIIFIYYLFRIYIIVSRKTFLYSHMRSYEPSETSKHSIFFCFAMTVLSCL